MQVTCPHCQESLRLPEDYAGQPLRCPGCKQGIRVRAPSAEAPATRRGRSADKPRQAQETALDQPEFNISRSCPACGASLARGQNRCRECGASYRAVHEAREETQESYGAASGLVDMGVVGGVILLLVGGGWIALTLMSGGRLRAYQWGLLVLGGVAISKGRSGDTSKGRAAAREATRRGRRPRR